MTEDELLAQIRTVDPDARRVGDCIETVAFAPHTMMVVNLATLRVMLP